MPRPRPIRIGGLHFYPFHDRAITVTRCGRICIGSRKINLSQVFAGQNVGIKEIADKVWLVSFMHYDLDFFDHETGRVECAQNPFEPKVLAVSRGHRNLLLSQIEVSVRSGDDEPLTDVLD